MSEIISAFPHKSTFVKKLNHSLVFSGLCVLSIPLYAYSLTLGRVVFVTVNLIWLKYFIKTDWTNTVLAYALVTVVLPPTFLASFTSTLVPIGEVYHYVIASFVAILLSAIMPMSDIYNFFANRVKKVYTLVLSTIITVVLMYTTDVTMGDGGDPGKTLLLIIVVSCLLFLFYKIAKHLDV